MNTLIGWINKNHIALVFVLVILLVVGIFTYRDLPKDVFPNGEFPRLQVIADMGFASLSDTEINVTRPIEEVLKTVPDVVEVRSTTERGTSTIDIYLRWGTNLDQSFQYVQSKINQVRGGLPANTDIEVVRMTTSTYPMSEYGIWSDQLDQKELYTAVRYTVIPKLIGIEGVYGLTVIGGEEPEIQVKLDPKKLIEYNLDAASIGSAIEHNNKISFIGTILKGKSAFFTIGGNKLTDIESIGKIVIAVRMARPIYLKDVARIDDFHVDTRRIVSVNGHKGLFIDVQKQETSDGVKLSKRIDEAMADIHQQFSGKLHIVKWDLSEFVARSVKGILLDIFIGIVLILLIIYCVINRFRYSVPIILVLPAIVIVEFVILKVIGLTVNIMTLGGLSAAIGIIADNAIVVTENYLRFRSEGGGANALSASMSDIVPLMIWATLVSIIVFVPLNLLSGVPGLFFKPLAITLVTTIILSLIMAVFIIPILISYFIESHEMEHFENREKSMTRVLKGKYLKLLAVSLRCKTVVVVLTALLLVAGLLVFLKLPTGFLPEWDEGDIVLDYIAPAGTSIVGTDEIISKVEKIISAYPEVNVYIRKTGTHLGTPFAAPTVGEIVILLNPHGRRSTFKIMDELRTEITEKIPDLETDFHQMLPDRLGDLTGVAKPIVVTVTGNDYDKLWDAAQDIKGRLEKIAGLNDVLINMPPAQKEMKVIANPERISLLGLNMTDVSHYSQLALYGEVVSYLQRGLQMIPIREFYEGNYRSNVEAIGQIPIYTPEGGVLPLGKIAAFEMVNQESEIHHKNGSLSISVNAEIAGRSLGSVIMNIKSSLSSIKRDAFFIELEGNYKDQQTSFRQLVWVLFISIVLILAALLFIFESYRTAVAVFLGTVSSASLVIFGLCVTATQFDVSSFTGMIAVMGIVVNNGILVIEFAERFRREGKGLMQSLIEAGNLRFRPVLITNLAAIAGFIPMALNVGHGGEVLQPFSVAMISGLVGSVFFSLIVMPAFYLILHSSKESVVMS